MSKVVKNLTRHLKRLDRLAEKAQQDLQRERDYRMWTGLFSLGAFSYSTFNKMPMGLALGAIGLFLIFPFFVYRSRKKQARLERLENWRSFIQRQEHRQTGQFQKITTTTTPLPADDMDIFGHPSLFSLLDETISERGETTLQDSLRIRAPKTEDIKKWQYQVKLVHKSFYFVRKLLLLAWSFGEKIPTQKMQEYIEHPIVGEGFSKRVLIGFGLWLAAVVSYAVQTSLPLGPLPGLFLFAYWLFSFSILGELARGFQAALGIERHFQGLSQFLKTIENFDQRENAIAEICQKTCEQKPSRELKGFATIVSMLSIQANPVLFMLLNAALPWTLFFTWRLEKSRLRMSSKLHNSLEEIAELESIWCRSLLMRYHTNTLPEIQDEEILQFQNLRHPLISREQVVDNEFSFEGFKTALITGSNMSGKSTFLRTVGINQALAVSGAPVFADKMQTWPARIESCLRVSDSVESGFSYFYAEVRRIRSIMDSLKAEEPIIYFIDEVFKGTNNRERLIAAKSLLRTLVRQKGLGFVTTHDLELSELATDNELIKNFHFADQFRDGEMTFDYKIKSGPCTTTNALKILEKEGLPIS